MTAQAAPVSFAATIKPYFSALDQQLMSDATHTGGFTVDLWDAASVQQNFNIIARVIAQGRMPPAGSPPDSDGPWSQDKITQFGSDFTAWQAGGYQP